MEKLGKETKLKTAVSNKFGTLYACKAKDGSNLSVNSTKLVLINGSQLAHYNDKGYGNQPLNIGDPFFGHGNDVYDSSIDTYIFKYNTEFRPKANSHVYAKGLENLLEYLDTDNIVILGKSYGAQIGLAASVSKLVKGVIAYCPSIMGSPLQNIEKLRSYKPKNIKEAIVIKLAIATMIKELGKGFTRENGNGMDDIGNIDVAKVHAYGGAINDLEPENMLERTMKWGADTIFNMSSELDGIGQRSDGMAVWDPQVLEKYHIPYTEIDKPHHRYTQTLEGNGRVLILAKKDGILR